jgi:hypothetical protein
MRFRKFCREWLDPATTVIASLAFILYLSIPGILLLLAIGGYYLIWVPLREKANQERDHHD